MSHRLYDGSRPVMSMLVAPFVRLDELGIVPKLGAILLGVGQVLWADLFTWLLAILLLSSGSDWFFGRKAARRRAEFSHDVSAWGLQSKAAGVMQVLIIRAVEYALMTADIIDTGGFAAVVVTAALIYQDISSIDEKRVALGGRPTPVLGKVLKWMERMTSALVPEATEDRRDGPDDRREEDGDP